MTWLLVIVLSGTAPCTVQAPIGLMFSAALCEQTGAAIIMRLRAEVPNVDARFVCLRQVQA